MTNSEVARQWWDSIPIDTQKELHRKSKNGHIPFVVFIQYNAFITKLYLVCTHENS